LLPANDATCVQPERRVATGATMTLNKTVVKSGFFAVLLLATQNVFANDSSAELGIGGLTLTQSDSISLDREDLYISAAEVRVRYEFTNASDQDQEVLVAFPLPDIDPSEQEGDRTTPDYENQLNFKTLVDGKRITYEFYQRAFFKDADITDRIKAIGLPLVDTTAGDSFDKGINALAKGERAVLVTEGLVEEIGSDGTQTLWRANWLIKTSVTRKQVFPAKSTIKVEHSYVPFAGGSVGGSLEPQYRDQDFAKAQKNKYCIDAGWFRSFDKEGRKRAGSAGGAFPHSETWLSYVLSSGANWKGPIKDFRLVVDKGNAANMVSFCASGVKKISPTQFEVRYKDFEPKDDLNILIVNWI
jgi:hypothetical protein